VEELLFSTILANALDNALNAQSGQSKEKGAWRGDIRLLLKNSSGKTLLCVKNTFHEAPLFRNGIPASFREGHGYGVQSILYITEKLGGNCQFTIEDDWFVLRVVV
jgi:sensor histidine kinase regulating citrate/malate metabolism